MPCPIRHLSLRLTTLLLLVACLPSLAQTQTGAADNNRLTRRDSIRQQLRQHAVRIDSMLAVRQQRTSYDTAFVVRPQSRITLKVRTSLSGAAFHTRGTMRKGGRTH